MQRVILEGFIHQLLISLASRHGNRLFFLEMLLSVEAAAHPLQTFICKGACNTASTVMEPSSAPARCVILSAVFPEVAQFAGCSRRGDLCQRAGAAKEHGGGGSAASAASPFNRAQTFHTSLRLIIPRDAAQALELYILSNKRKQAI